MSMLYQQDDLLSDPLVMEKFHAHLKSRAKPLWKDICLSPSFLQKLARAAKAKRQKNLIFTLIDFYHLLLSARLQYKNHKLSEQKIHISGGKVRFPKNEIGMKMQNVFSSGTPATVQCHPFDQ